MNKRLMLKLRDRSWRLRHLYKIVDKHGQKINLIPNTIQKLINNDPSQYKLILKARQFGVSTNELIKMLDFVCFKRNMTACILAHEDDAIAKLFRIVRHAYENMPEEIKPRLAKGGGSMYELYFPQINSRIYCDLESRGNTIHKLHVSEAAFMKDSSKLKSTIEAVPLHCEITVETTPNGIGNYFYDLWNDDDSKFSKLFYPWYLFPSYRMALDKDIKPTEEELALIKKAKTLFNIDIDHEQLAFRRHKKSMLKTSSHDKRKITFEQEYPEDDETCFLVSGERVIDQTALYEQTNMARNPIGSKEGITIFVKPNKTRTYVCGADVAEGISKDWSFGVIIDVDAMEIVATLRAKCSPKDFADKLAYLCRKYAAPGQPPPELAVERNNHGHAVLLRLDDHCRYEALYLDPKDERPGWRTTSISRPLMIDEFIDAVENKILKVNDKNILNECATLVDDEGKIQAASGKNDDGVMASSIALQLCKKSRIIEVYKDLHTKILF